MIPRPALGLLGVVLGCEQKADQPHWQRVKVPFEKTYALEQGIRYELACMNGDETCPLTDLRPRSVP